MKDITPVQYVPPLRAKREQIGMTREELAFRAHVSAKTIERLERAGAGSPHRVTQQAIATVLDCDAGDLWPQEQAA